MEEMSCWNQGQHDYDTCECDCELCDAANRNERPNRVHFATYATTASMMEEA